MPLRVAAACAGHWQCARRDPPSRCALVLLVVLGVGAMCGPWARLSWRIVASLRMRKLPLATATWRDSDATVTLVCSGWTRNQRCFERPPGGPARLALLNLGLVGLLEVRLDDRAVELPADTADSEVGEDGGQAPPESASGQDRQVRSAGPVGRAWRACRLQLAWWCGGGRVVTVAGFTCVFGGCGILEREDRIYFERLRCHEVFLLPKVSGMSLACCTSASVPKRSFHNAGGMALGLPLSVMTQWLATPEYSDLGLDLLEEYLARSALSAVTASDAAVNGTTVLQFILQLGGRDEV